MKDNKHVQCMLRNGPTIMTAWIPKEIAVKGCVVDLSDPENGEAKGWTVVTVGSQALDSKWVNERSRDHLHQRGVSDI